MFAFFLIFFAITSKKKLVTILKWSTRRTIDISEKTQIFLFESRDQIFAISVLNVRFYLKKSQKILVIFDWLRWRLWRQTSLTKNVHYLCQINNKLYLNIYIFVYFVSILSMSLFKSYLIRKPCFIFNK